MVNVPVLFGPPSDREIELCSRLHGREFAIFSALLLILGDNYCRDKLRCPSPLAILRRESSGGRHNHFRSAFVHCYRLLNLSERKLVRSFLLDTLWQAYLGATTRDSYLHSAWLTEDSNPGRDTAFLSWCAGKNCSRLTAADLFFHLVRLDCCVFRAAFLSVWDKLSGSSAAQLRATMWRIVKCGAKSVGTVTCADTYQYCIRTSTRTCEI